jgi:hypothetical protein
MGQMDQEQIFPTFKFKTAKELKKAIDAHGVLQFIMEVDLGDLIDLNLEGLNNLTDEWLSGIPGVMAILSDISYRVVGHTEGDDNGCTATGSVLIEVTGATDDFEWAKE